MSFAERFESDFAWFAPSPMITPRSAAFCERRRVGAGRDEDQLVEDRRQSAVADLDVPVAVDRLRLEAALDDAAGDELGDRLDVAVEDVAERRQPDREACGHGPAGEPVLRRRRRRGATVSRSSFAASPALTVRTPAGRQRPATRRRPS